MVLPSVPSNSTLLKGSQYLKGGKQRISDCQFYKPIGRTCVQQWMEGAVHRTAESARAMTGSEEEWGPPPHLGEQPGVQHLSWKRKLQPRLLEWSVPGYQSFWQRCGNRAVFLPSALPDVIHSVTLWGLGHRRGYTQNSQRISNLFINQSSRVRAEITLVTDVKELRPCHVKVSPG